VDDYLAYKERQRRKRQARRDAKDLKQLQRQGRFVCAADLQPGDYLTRHLDTVADVQYTPATDVTPGRVIVTLVNSDSALVVRPNEKLQVQA
jgi:hypothetical protein